MDYEVQRDHFDKIVKAYKDYLNLYMLVNGGEVEGASEFGEFYMRFTYYGKYATVDEIQSTGN